MTASQMNTSEKMNATMVCQVYTVTIKQIIHICEIWGDFRRQTSNVLIFIDVAGVFQTETDGEEVKISASQSFFKNM